MSSSTDIANLSLGRLAVGQAIASLSEQSAPARLCNRFYNQCRREVLQAFPYGFASTAIALAQEADQEFPGWAYVYTYPTNALNVSQVSDAQGIRSILSWSSSRAIDWSQYDLLRRTQQPFKIALRTDGAGRVILSDISSAYAFVTYDVTNTAVFPPDFVSVLAWRLAMEVGGPLKAKADLVAQARNEYLFWRSLLGARELNEQVGDSVSESPSISCRM
jgi:hypothetical protein